MSDVCIEVYLSEAIPCAFNIIVYFSNAPNTDAETAERAVKELDGLEVMGRQLRADHAQKKESGGFSGGGGRGGGGYGGKIYFYFLLSNILWIYEHILPYLYPLKAVVNLDPSRRYWHDYWHISHFEQEEEAVEEEAETVMVEVEEVLPTDHSVHGKHLE